MLINIPYATVLEAEGLRNKAAATVKEEGADGPMFAFGEGHETLNEAVSLVSKALDILEEAGEDGSLLVEYGTLNPLLLPLYLRVELLNAR